MRYEKAAALLKLASHLASSSEGLTLDEMAEIAEVGRRTAERMRDALSMVFPEMEDTRDGATKRFKISGGLSSFYLAPTVDELAELANSAVQWSQQGFESRSNALSSLSRKIEGAMKEAARRRYGPDIEALAGTEIQGVRVGPRPKDDPEIVNVVRRAIKSGQMVRFRYQGGSNPGARREVEPLGLILDRYTYLVALLPGHAEPRNWRVDRIFDISLTPQAYSIPSAFDLSEYASRSFGIFHDAVEDVHLLILPEGAAEASTWVFHPNQQITENPDGSVSVTFRTGGMLELAWHLFTWGRNIRILGPQRLKDAMAEALREAQEQIPLN